MLERYFTKKPPFFQQHFSKRSFSALPWPGDKSHFVAVKAELIYYIFQVAFFHSDYFKAILENSQEATLITNKKIIGYLAL